MSANLVPDLDATHAFLTALDPDRNAKFGFRTFDDRGDDIRLAVKCYGTISSGIRQSSNPAKDGKACVPANLLVYMQSLRAGAFVVPNELDGRGQFTNNVIRVRLFYVDADTDAQIASLNWFIAASGLVPSIVVESGGITAGGQLKLQAYWLIHDCPIDAFAGLQALLLSRTGTDPAVKDLARLMRLVGFWHQKREPRMTRIVSITSNVYYRSDFERRVRAQPQIAALVSTQNARNRGVRRNGAAAPRDGRDRTARLRALLDHYGGLITPSVHALLREAQAPTDGGIGNRHQTLKTVVARLVQCKWPDADIAELVLPISNAEWGDGDWRAHLERITTWVRAREAATLAAAPALSERAAKLVAAFSKRPSASGGSP